MHKQHLQQVNKRYSQSAAKSWRAQLVYALEAAASTRGSAATHWADNVERLVGRLALNKAGGTLSAAAVFLEEVGNDR